MQQKYTLEEVREIRKKAREEGYKRGFNAAKREKKDITEYLRTPSPAKAEQEGLRWVPIVEGMEFPKDKEMVIKFDTGELCMFSDEMWPFAVATHYLIVQSESTTTPVKEAGQPTDEYEAYVQRLQLRINELESRQQPAGEYDWEAAYHKLFAVYQPLRERADEGENTTKERGIAFAEWIQRKWIPTYENNKLHSWRFFGSHDHEWYGKDYTTAQLYDLSQQSQNNKP